MLSLLESRCSNVGTLSRQYSENDNSREKKKKRWRRGWGRMGRGACLTALFRQQRQSRSQHCIKFKIHRTSSRWTDALRDDGSRMSSCSSVNRLGKDQWTLYSFEDTIIVLTEYSFDISVDSNQLWPLHAQIPKRAHDIQTTLADRSDPIRSHRNHWTAQSIQSWMISSPSN